MKDTKDTNENLPAKMYAILRNVANAPLNSEARHEPRSSSLKNFPIILSLNDSNMVTLLILLGQEIVTKNSD